MRFKKNILITSVALFLVAALVYFFYFNKTKEVIKIRGGSVHFQKFNTPSVPFTSKISQDDSLQYGAIIADYDYYWETTQPNKKIKRVAFDRKSGTILLYESIKETPFNPTKPSLMFQWQFDETTPNLIKGIYGYTEKDTTMCWIYDTKKQLMLDEKGLVYKRKFLTRKFL
ncbi:hypothetical protein [Flavobacterium chungnamense]|uniref:Lipoprotein n=1 Tax=Flavobacterium chungnamense TaxID=706182 RepID=A0ABP7V2L2_9FLAO